MLGHLRRSLVLSVFCLVFFGFAYALAGTGVAQALFSHQADGSLTANGSTLIGQNWALAKCTGHPRGSCVFQGRPDDLGPYASTTTGHPTGGQDDPLTATGNANHSGATNFGPRSAKFLADTKTLVAYWHRMGVPNPTPDLVTTSGSGIDPDLKPVDALAEVGMVSKATGVSPQRLRALITRETHGRQLGFLGSDYIVVLTLNEALAKMDGRSS